LISQRGYKVKGYQKEFAIHLISLCIDFLPLKVLKMLRLAINDSLGYGAGGFAYVSENKSIKKLVGSDLDLIVFDIGANKGDWAYAFSQIFRNSKIFCFEPHPDSFDIIKSRLQKHKYIEIVNLALSNVVGKTPLYTIKNLWGGASIIPDAVNKHIYPVEVNVTTLDEFCRLHNIMPDVIKIDVEGAEMLVLKGGINTIQRVKIVEFEFGMTQYKLKLYFKDFFEFFSENGFQIARISRKRIIKVPIYDPSEEYFRTTNYIAYKN